MYFFAFSRLNRPPRSRVTHGYLDPGGYSTEPCIPGYWILWILCIADTKYCGYQHPHGIRDTGYSIHARAAHEYSDGGWVGAWRPAGGVAAAAGAATASDVAGGVAAAVDVAPGVAPGVAPHIGLLPLFSGHKYM